jgi:hypothetical protein
VEHLASLISLHVRFEDIICQQSVSAAEKMRRLEIHAMKTVGNST